jgi:ABC-2 type transport system ATP-binding protein
VLDAEALPPQEGEEVAAALDARAVEKRYGGTRALAGVDLRVDAGELVGLLGPNGAGKSLLIKIACGLVRADHGSVTVCGAPAGSPAARARLGYLAETFRFPDFLTADEVLALHQQLAGSRGGAQERTRLLALAGLEDVATRRTGTLSKGMQQRLGLAQALVGEPDLVLLDEPTSALDPIGRAAVRELLAALRERGTAVLLNSHQLTDIERTCDRVALLRDGRVVLEGRVADLLRDPGTTLEDVYVRAMTP